MNPTTSFTLVQAAEANFPTEYGLFRIFGFEGHFGTDGSEAETVEEAAALTMGDVRAEIWARPRRCCAYTPSA